MANVDALMTAAETGLVPMKVDPGAKETALRNLRRWLTEDAMASYRPQIEWLIGTQQWELLLDSFYQTIPFGTGGRRGPVGVGTNRINAWTIGASVQGHCEFLHAAFPNRDPLHVVIAYDVRVFRDANGRYNPDLPNPALGLGSLDLAHAAAEVYAANGVVSHILPADSPRLLSTPELSFTIRYLQAQGGINLSASHNPPDDNGGKFYDSRGGQEIPPNDQRMADLVDLVDDIRRMPFDPAVAKGLVVYLDDTPHEAYLAMNQAQSLCRNEARSARIVYTPLHGTGTTTVQEVLRSEGFDVTLVDEQATPDGRFPNVKYRTPNPEVPESMDRAVALARQIDADLVLSTDPDADRIGVFAPRGDQWVFVTGNEIAAILTWFKLDRLKQRGQLPDHPVVIKTEVTSTLVTRIAARFGCHVVTDLLVGFKYIADVLYQFESRGQYGRVHASVADFILGTEESHGILVTPEVRDKDAAGAALLLAELASVRKNAGSALLDVLDEIYLRYGYVCSRLVPMVMQGIRGMTNIHTIQDTLRRNPPTEVEGLTVRRTVDLQDPTGPLGPHKSETDRVSRNVLIFELEDNARVIIRPSGTEPKNKLYIEVADAPLPAGSTVADLRQAQRATDARADLIGVAFTRYALNIIDVEMPDWGLRVSGLVSLTNRLDFVNTFLDELVGQAKPLSAADLAAWADTRLQAYGKDPRGLVAPGVASYLDAKADSVGDPALIDTIRAAFA